MNGRDWGRVILVSIVAIVYGTVLPSTRRTVFALWTITMLAYGLIVLARRLELLKKKSRFDELMAPAVNTPERPADLESCEHSFSWRSYSPKDFHHELRPKLAALIEHRAKGRADIDPQLVQICDPQLNQGDGSLIRTTDLDRMISKIEEM
jgi:hypothetical protein